MVGGVGGWDGKRARPKARPNKTQSQAKDSGIQRFPSLPLSRDGAGSRHSKYWQSLHARTSSSPSSGSTSLAQHYPSVTHDAPGSSIATTATATASTNDEDVAAGGSTCGAPNVLLVALVAATAACRLRRLFDYGDCDASDCGELAHDEPIFEINWVRSQRCVCARCGSRSA
ncbi:hypothetical protein EI94DRAFT_1736754, partial [Lactarius quietus]